MSTRPDLGPTHPPNQWALGTVTPEVKWPGHEGDHSAKSSAKVNKAWSYIPTPQYIFMVW